MGEDLALCVRPKADLGGPVGGVPGCVMVRGSGYAGRFCGGGRPLKYCFDRRLVKQTFVQLTSLGEELGQFRRVHRLRRSK